MRSSPLRSLSFGTLTLAATALGPAAGIAQDAPARPTTAPTGELTAWLDAETGARPGDLLDAGTGVAPRAAVARRPGTARHADTAFRPDTALRPDTTTQSEDYSVAGMFSRLHGDFMQEALRFQPTLQFQFGYYDATTIEDEVGDIEFHGARFDARHRIPVDPDTYLLLGGAYGVRQYDFSQPQSNRAFVEDTDLHEVGVDIGAGRFFSEDLLVEAVFRPGVYSDLSGTLTSNDWQFFGDLIATWRAADGSDGLSPVYLKGGIRVDETFADVPVYPLLGVTWHITESVRLDVLLPEEARISWMPSSQWIFSGGVDVQGDLYHYRMRSATNAEQVQLEARTQELRLFLEGTYRLSDTVSIFGRGGGVLTGDYDWEGVNNPRPDARDSDWDGAIDPTVFVEVGVGIDF